MGNYGQNPKAIRKEDFEVEMNRQIIAFGCQQLSQFSIQWFHITNLFLIILKLFKHVFVKLILV